jgi:hypothetical protein
LLLFIFIEEVLRLYPTLHEADITKFFDVADTYFNAAKDITSLKKLRQAANSYLKPNLLALQELIF